MHVPLVHVWAGDCVDGHDQHGQREPGLPARALGHRKAYRMLKQYEHLSVVMVGDVSQC